MDTNDRLLCKICYNDAFTKKSYNLILCSSCYCLYCDTCLSLCKNKCQYCNSINFLKLDTRKSELKSILLLTDNNNNNIDDEKTEINTFLHNLHNILLYDLYNNDNNNIKETIRIYDTIKTYIIYNFKDLRKNKKLMKLLEEINNNCININIELQNIKNKINTHPLENQEESKSTIIGIITIILFLIIPYMILTQIIYHYY
jgi:hypothetical protein